MTEHSLRETLERELELLAQTRDELRVRMHLAKAEAKDEWHKLEASFNRVSTELSRTSEHAKRPVEDLTKSARALLDELRRGYDRVKGELKI